MLKKMQEREAARGGHTGARISLDICIAMDTTGSMEPYLVEAKKAVESLFVRVNDELQGSSGTGAATFRFAFISYKDRDFADQRLERGHLQFCDFTSDSRVAANELALIHAKGGGDIAEDVGDALEKAASLQWASDFRLLVHFLDAPPHGRANHDLDERYDARVEDTEDIACLVRSLASNRIDYVMVRCGGEEELRYTEKIARLCKEAYEEARRAMQAKHVLGHLPRFKAFSLDTSDASEFLSVMLQVIGVAVVWQ
jgi:hypothetical protein